MGRQKVARDGSEWSLFTHLKEEMGGDEALTVSEGKHLLGVRTQRTRGSPVSAAAVLPCPEGCPQLQGQEARGLGQPRFPSCPAVVPCSLQPRAPADYSSTQLTEPSLVRGPCGGPCVLEDWERGEEGGFWRPRLSQGY